MSLKLEVIIQQQKQIKDNLAAKQINYEIQPHSSKTIG